MSERDNSKKRFQLFIDKEVQGKLAKRFLLHWCGLAFCLFAVLAIVHLVSHSFESGMSSFWDENGRIFIVMALLTPAFLWDAIKFSHRFVGPIFRLREALKALSNGESVKDLKFRDGDFWQEMAESFNQVRKQVEDARSSANPVSGVTREEKTLVSH